MRILVATDGSEGGREAVHQAVDLARELDAELVVVAVEHLASATYALPPYSVADTSSHEIAEAAVREAVEAARDARVPARGQVLPVGEIAGQIVDAARDVDAGLIVVGSRGHGAVLGTLLGSVSRGVVRRADRPVLVAKARVPVAA